MPTKAPPAIVLGDGINALNVAQSLGEHRVPVHVIGTQRSCISESSRYVISRSRCADTNGDELRAEIQRIADACREKPVLMVCSDHFLEVACGLEEQLTNVRSNVLPSRPVAKMILDKAAFGRFCMDNKLPIPRTWLANTVDDANAIEQVARFPLVIKPQIAHAARSGQFEKDGEFAKMVRADNSAELRNHLIHLVNAGAMPLVQEYIDGPDDEHYSYFSYRESCMRETAGIGIRKLRVLPIHAGAGTFAEIADEPELKEISQRLLGAMKYRGISSVCFKRHQASGELYLHEVNGRFPMLHRSALLGGVNLPMIAYCKQTGQTLKRMQPAAAHKKFVHLDGDVYAFHQYHKAGELGIRNWLLSLLSIRRCAELSLRDPGPFFVWLRTIMRRHLAGKAM